MSPRVRGRKPLDPDGRPSERLSVCVPPELHDRVCQAAVAQGVDVTVIIRRCLERCLHNYVVRKSAISRPGRY
jgi:predicted HicB family RNase H-like nuclease